MGQVFTVLLKSNRHASIPPRRKSFICGTFGRNGSLTSQSAPCRFCLPRKNVPGTNGPITPHDGLTNFHQRDRPPYPPPRRAPKMSRHYSIVFLLRIAAGGARMLPRKFQSCSQTRPKRELVNEPEVERFPMRSAANGGRLLPITSCCWSIILSSCHSREWKWRANALSDSRWDARNCDRVVCNGVQGDCSPLVWHVCHGMLSLLARRIGLCWKAATLGYVSRIGRICTNDSQKILLVELLRPLFVSLSSTVRHFPPSTRDLGNAGGRSARADASRATGTNESRECHVGA